MIKYIIKCILNYKSFFIKNKGKKAFIHPLSTIIGYRYLQLSNNAKIYKGVSIGIVNGKLILGDSSYINHDCSIHLDNCKLVIGKESFFNNNCNVIGLGNINIGDHVLIGPMCNIISTNHKYNDKHKCIINQGMIGKGIIIEDDVWIGANCTVLDGITIGKGSVIAAGAVVNKNVGQYEVWGGVPAKFIKKR